MRIRKEVFGRTLPGVAVRQGRQARRLLLHDIKQFYFEHERGARLDHGR